MINVIDFVMLLLPGAFYLIMFFVYRNKCADITPKDGIIANWKSGFFRYTGALIIKEDDKEYSTAAYFNIEEAKDMVGKTASYVIIDETLIVYEIKE